MRTVQNIEKELESLRKQVALLEELVALRAKVDELTMMLKGPPPTTEPSTRWQDHLTYTPAQTITQIEDASPNSVCYMVGDTPVWTPFSDLLKAAAGGGSDPLEPDTEPHPGSSQPCAAHSGGTGGTGRDER